MATKTQMTCKLCRLPFFSCANLMKHRDDGTQICSCHNVTKGDLVSNVQNGTCKSIGQVKSCTKAGTGCGGCMPLVQSIFSKTLLDMGQEVSNNRKSRFGTYNCGIFDSVQFAVIFPIHEQTFTTSLQSKD